MWVLLSWLSEPCSPDVLHLFWHLQSFWPSAIFLEFWWEELIGDLQFRLPFLIIPSCRYLHPLIFHHRGRGGSLSDDNLTKHQSRSITEYRSESFHRFYFSRSVVFGSTLSLWAIQYLLVAIQAMLIMGPFLWIGPQSDICWPLLLVLCHHCSITSCRQDRLSIKGFVAGLISTFW